MLIGITASSLFDLMPALGTNVATVLIGRFFGGLFGVAPVAIFGGVLGDCWPLAQRGIAMALAVSLVFSGPTWGPVWGGVHNGISVPWLEMDYVGRCHYRTGLYTPLCAPLPRDVSSCDPTGQSTGSAKEEWESEYQDCIG